MKELLRKLKPLEIGLKKFALRVFSPILKCRERGPLALGERQWKKILLVRHEKIGDVIIALALVDELKKRFPGCKVSFMGSRQNIVVVKSDPRFDKVFVFNKSFRVDLGMIRAARKEKFDCVIDLITHDSVTSMLLTRLCGSRALKIGIGKSDHTCYYNCHVPHPLRNPGRHIVDFHLDLIKVLGVEPGKPGQYAPLYIDDKADRAASAFMESRDISKGRKFGVNISAGEPSRDWGADNFAILIDKMLDRFEDCELIIITTPHEYHLGQRIKEVSCSRVHIIPEGLDLITVAAIIRKLDLLVSPDTSLVHIAGAFRVPVVALYRRFMGEYKFWRPLHQKGGVVLSGRDEDVSDITVEQVLDEIVNVINEFEVIQTSFSDAANRGRLD